MGESKRKATLPRRIGEDLDTTVVGIGITIEDDGGNPRIFSLLRNQSTELFSPCGIRLRLELLCARRCNGLARRIVDDLCRHLRQRPVHGHAWLLCRTLHACADASLAGEPILHLGHEHERQ